MARESDASVVVTGLGRNLANDVGPTAFRLEMGPDSFTLANAGQQPVIAAYRDLETLAVDQGRVLLVLNGRQVRLIAEQLGAGLATLVGELRERRARQMLTDRLIDLPDGERLELFEYADGGEHGVAQLAFHPWGVALMPLDERRPWRQVRRADIRAVRPDQTAGKLSVETTARPGAGGAAFELLGLGLDTVRTAQRLATLREGALGDAAAIVARLAPDAPVSLRQRAASLLVDGHPTSPKELDDAWGPIERAVLAEPTFAATYAALCAKSGAAAPDGRWIALAPVRPGDPTENMAWFLVGLPGDMLAFELVSTGAHATYLFRAPDSFEAAVFDVSECLIDSRFLRSAIYLTDAALADARNQRQRLAINALPSLRAARARFVGRLIHTDEAAWATSLDEALKWNAANPGATSAWPGTDQDEGD
jgi:hypothetical protein